MVSPPARKVALVFPGQASQRAGMAKPLLQEPLARAVFRRASEALGIDLTALCAEGDDESLTRTDIAQPALLTTSAAWAAVLADRGVVAHMAAGHSLGEFSAWVVTGVLGFDQAVRLVRRRGELMEDAARRNPGGMLAVIGLSDEQVREVCERARKGGVLVAANYNCPGQVVLSGGEAALERAADEVKRMRGRAIPLRVSGAFHSPLMEDAAHAFGRLVSEIELNDPKIPVVVNATAEPVVDARGARAAMERQMTSPVLWTSSVRRMVAEGVKVFVEVGPGEVLTKLIERTSADIAAVSVGGPRGLSDVLEEVGR